MNTYDLGDSVEVFAAFTKRKLTYAEQKAFRETKELPPEIAVEPGKVKCTALAPDGTTEEIAINESEEVFVAFVEPNQHGTWWVAIDGSEGFKAAGELSFQVREQKVPR